MTSSRSFSMKRNKNWDSRAQYGIKGGFCFCVCFLKWEDICIFIRTTQERDRWMKCELRTLGRERVGSACSYMSFFDCTTSQFFSMLWYVENLCGTEYGKKEGKLKIGSYWGKIWFPISFLFENRITIYVL